MSSRSKFYTGIGSRETPQDVLNTMIAIAAHLRVEHWKLRSGGADGADTAFQTGAEPHYEIFLPWLGFNNAPRNDKRFVSKHVKGAQAQMIAADIHPAWHNCSNADRKLHARNVMQVLGPTLDVPSRFVICWTAAGLMRGGTRTALVLAERNNIPIFNLYDLAFSGMTPEAVAEAAIQADLKLHPPQ